MKKIVGVAVFALFVAVGAGAYQYNLSNQAPKTSVNLSGTVEARIFDIGFAYPGRIVDLAVDEGDAVSAGQVVGRLDDSDLAAEEARAAASIATAAAVVDEVSAGARSQEIASARDLLVAADARVAEADLNLDRLRKLHEYGAVARADVDVAERNQRVLRAEQSRAREQLSLVRSGPRIETIRTTQARLAEALQSRQVISTRREKFALVSPSNGMVLDRLAEPGEVVGAGMPVLRIADMNDVWVIAYLSSDLFGRVDFDRPVELTVPSLPGRALAGRVFYIGDEAEFTPRTVQTPDERSRLVFRIKVKVEDPDGLLRPGMPIDLKVALR